MMRVVVGICASTLLLVACGVRPADHVPGYQLGRSAAVPPPVGIGGPLDPNLGLLLHAAQGASTRTYRCTDGRSVADLLATAARTPGHAPRALLDAFDQAAAAAARRDPAAIRQTPGERRVAERDRLLAAWGATVPEQTRPAPDPFLWTAAEARLAAACGDHDRARAAVARLADLPAPTASAPAGVPTVHLPAPPVSLATATALLRAETVARVATALGDHTAARTALRRLLHTAAQARSTGPVADTFGPLMTAARLGVLLRDDPAARPELAALAASIMERDALPWAIAFNVRCALGAQLPRRARRISLTIPADPRPHATPAQRAALVALHDARLPPVSSQRSSNGRCCRSPIASPSSMPSGDCASRPLSTPAGLPMRAAWHRHSTPPLPTGRKQHRAQMPTPGPARTPTPSRPTGHSSKSP